jgi:hypothetical protein
MVTIRIAIAVAFSTRAVLPAAHDKETGFFRFERTEGGEIGVDSKDHTPGKKARGWKSHSGSLSI